MQWREPMRTLRLSLTLLLILLAFTRPSGLRGAAPSTGACAGAACQIYLPLTAYNPQIVLFAPAAGTASVSLAPVLLWRAPVPGTYLIQVSEDSAFAPTSSFPLSETKDVLEPLPE